MKRVLFITLFLLVFPTSSFAAKTSITPPSADKLSVLLETRKGHLRQLLDTYRSCPKPSAVCERKIKALHAQTDSLQQQIAETKSKAYSELESLAVKSTDNIKKESALLLDKEKRAIEESYKEKVNKANSETEEKRNALKEKGAQDVAILQKTTEDNLNDALARAVRESRELQKDSFKSKLQEIKLQGIKIKKATKNKIKKKIKKKAEIALKITIENITKESEEKYLEQESLLGDTLKDDLASLDQALQEKIQELEIGKEEDLKAAEEKAQENLNQALEGILEEKSVWSEKIQALKEEDLASRVTQVDPPEWVLPEDFFGVMSQVAIPGPEARVMADGGVSAYRIPLSWDSIQASSNHQFNWQAWDLQIRDLAAANIEVLPIMMGTPAGFAEKYSVFPIYNDHQRQGWEKYLRGAVQRYGPEGSFWRENRDIPYLPVRTWQIWNEANWTWFADEISPEKYLELLKNSYQIIKSEDPQAKIMLTSLFAKAKNEPGEGLEATRFLEQVYRLGGKNYFEEASLNPYSKNAKGMANAIEEFRQVMNSNQDASKDLHITEIGWGSGTKTPFDTGSETKQARALLSGYRYLLQNRQELNIESVYWFSWKDLPESSRACQFCYHTGFFEENSGELIAKPSWEAFTSITGRYE